MLAEENYLKKRFIKYLLVLTDLKFKTNNKYFPYFLIFLHMYVQTQIWKQANGRCGNCSIETFSCGSCIKVGLLYIIVKS